MPEKQFCVRDLLEFPMDIDEIRQEADAQTEANGEALQQISATLFRDQIFESLLSASIGTGEKFSLLAFDELQDDLLRLPGMNEACVQQVIATCKEISLAMRFVLADMFIKALLQEEDIGPFIQLQKKALDAMGPEDRDESFFRFYISCLIDEERKKVREEKLLKN